ncbi:MAG: alpha/beta fold hydrolase [Acidimicrobiales bacterium]
MKLVFLHALPFDGAMWEDTIGALGREAVAPSLFDLGDSIEEWAFGVLDAVGTEELIVVGCSVGGSCALEVAAAAPDQVAAIVLVGAKAEVNHDPVLRDEAIQMLETHGIEAAWHRYWLPLFAESTSSSVKDSARSWAMAHDVDSVVRGVRAFHDRRDLSSFAARWDRPLIGISGDRDVAPSPSKLRQLATGPNREFHLVAECGHYVNLEQPAAFDALLAEAIRPIVERS